MQRELAFLAQDSMEATERRNLLGVAFLRLREIAGGAATLHARELLIWVFNATQSGLSGCLQKSYRELAAAPWGLCCSEDKARDVVRLLQHHRILAVDEQRYRSYGQRPNAYTIDWEGIRAMLGIRVPGVGDVPTHRERNKPGGPGAQGAGPAAHPPPPAATRGGPAAHPFKEETPDPDPDIRSSFTFRAGGGSSGKEFLGRDQVIAACHELAAAAATTIKPLPAGTCAKGVFLELTTGEIRRPIGLLGWFRRQLSAPRPILENTEADFLLAIATALYVNAQPNIQKPVGLFARIVSGGDWRRVLPYVAQARRKLDEAIGERGEAPLGRANKAEETA